MPAIGQQAPSLVPFRPVLVSEIPSEWHVQDERQIAEARASYGMAPDAPLRAVTVLEVPDMQPFWAYEAWSRAHAASDHVPILVVSRSDFRDGGAGAEEAARDSLRSLLQTGRPSLCWARVFVRAPGVPWRCPYVSPILYADGHS